MVQAPLWFEFRKVGNLDGRYLLKKFDVAFTLLGKQYSQRELFALDTGSPMTLLRWKAFDPPVGALQYDPKVKAVEVKGWCGTTHVISIPDVVLSTDDFSILLPSAKIDRNLDHHDFSLLGTDSLESFEMSFAPARAHALLIPKEIRTAAEIDAEYVDAALHGATEMLCDEDKKLLELDVGERTITQHLAKHLQQYFPGWNVDCEYNRVGDVPDTVKKVLPRSPVSGDDESEPGERSVFPDIIVHRRGDRDANLLIIEVKKKGRGGQAGDKEKLRLYVGELGYRNAYFLSVPTGDQFGPTQCAIERIES